jgi:hypothetical protein
LGGHPETSIHTALLSALYLLVRGAARPAEAWLRLAAAWALAAVIAAVQLLPLALLLPATSKWQAVAGGALPPLALRLVQPLRLVLPQLYGHPATGTWWGPFNYSATAVYAGAAALPLAMAGLAYVRRDRRWAAMAALLAFSFLAAYHLPGVHELLQLPPLGRVAHHRLLFGVELGLALLAGAGCERWLGTPADGGRKALRGILTGSALVVALLAAAWLVYRADWAARGLLREQTLWTAGGAAVALLLAASLALRPAHRWWLLPLLIAITVIDLLAAHGRIHGRLPLARLYPDTPAVRFLRAQPGRVAAVGEALRPNAATVYALDDIRGDDPVKLARYERLYARLARTDPVYSQPIERWTDPWLDRLGVRWVIAAPHQLPPVNGWRLAYDGNDARIWQRARALPLVRWEDVDGASEEKTSWVGLKLLPRRPGLWEIAWTTPRPRLLVVAETWEAGWRATVNGQSVPVEPIDGVLLGVHLPAGQGHLSLRYRPRGLIAGALLSSAGLAIAFGWAITGLKRRQPLPPPRSFAALRMTSGGVETKDQVGRTRS